MRACCAVLFAALLLGGCAGLRSQSTGRASTTQTLTREDAEAALAALVAFDFEGRVAIRQADKGVQATLSWAQQGADARLRLSGPFGAGAVRVSLAEGELSIEDNQGVRLVGTDAEQALALQLGFSPPIATLRWWLLGLPAPESAAQAQRDEAGRLAQLMQDGWQVDYLSYRDESLAGGRAAMPRSLRATRGALDLRLVIDRWNLGP